MEMERKHRDEKREETPTVVTLITQPAQLHLEHSGGSDIFLIRGLELLTKLEKTELAV